MQPCREHATNGDHWNTLKNTEYIGELENMIWQPCREHAGGLLEYNEEHWELKNMMLWDATMQRACRQWWSLEYIEEHRVHWRTREHDLATMHAESMHMLRWITGVQWRTLSLKNMMLWDATTQRACILPVVITGVHWRTQSTLEN